MNATVRAFIEAIAPGNVELYLASFNQKKALRDATQIIADLRAAHPADDDEPIDKEFLAAAGWTQGELGDWSNPAHDICVSIWESRERPNAWCCRIEDSWFPDRDNRGDLRRLLAALGIKSQARAQAKP